MSGWAAIGGAVDGLFGASAAAISNVWNRREAKANRDYQTVMSNTAVRRHAADLEKAGFNRILAATGGKTASTPPGAQARAVQPPRLTPVASAMALKRATEEVKNLGLTGNQIKATTDYIGQQTATSAAQQALIEQNMVIRGHEEHMAKLLGEVAQGPGREIFGALKATGAGAATAGGILGLTGYFLKKWMTEKRMSLPPAGEFETTRDAEIRRQRNKGGPKPPPTHRRETGQTQKRRRRR